ncbi:MAG: hypothetical protein ACI31S_01110 [Bacilli bacterium]
MKKALLLIAIIIILSGCGSNETLTCTTSNKLGTLSSNSTYKIDYRDNDVKKLTITYEYKDNHTDGVGTGTDGTTNDNDNNNNNTTNANNNDNNNNNTTNNNTTNNVEDNDGIIDGVVGEALDDVVTGVTDGILDIAGIKARHNNRFGTYTNTEGFTTNIDTDNDNDYKVTYTYDLSKLSDADLAKFGISRDFNTQKNTYTNQGLTCK